MTRETQMFVDAYNGNLGLSLYYEGAFETLHDKGCTKEEAIEKVATDLKRRMRVKLSADNTRTMDPFFEVVIREALEKVDLKEVARQLAELGGAWS